jgi:serine/threonine-protein kinase
MGSVYEAVHTRIKSKRAAVKVIHSEFAGDQSILSRFEREANAAASIGHEGIIDIYDFGHDEDGSPYLVMEFLEGRSLTDEIKLARQDGRGGIVNIDFAIYVACNVLSALGAAHEAGVVHRDLKPDNIFLVDTGASRPRVKLLDFGIARIKKTGDPEQFSLTRTGAVMGTPYFMSPEQAQGLKDQVDQRTDLWALGVLLYVCLTGRFPYDGENFAQQISRLVSTFEPAEPSVLNPKISPEFEEIILKSMCKDLDRRYSSAEQMLADLRPLADEATLSVLSLAGRRSVKRPDPEMPETLVSPSGQSVLPKTIHTPSPSSSSAFSTSALTGGITAERTGPKKSQRGLMLVLFTVVAVVVAAIVLGVALGFGGLRDGEAAAASEPSPEPVSRPSAKAPVVEQPLPTKVPVVEQPQPLPTKAPAPLRNPSLAVEANRESDVPPNPPVQEPTDPPREATSAHRETPSRDRDLPRPTPPPEVVRPRPETQPWTQPYGGINTKLPAEPLPHGSTKLGGPL